MAEIKMYTTPWCGDCRTAKRFLNGRGIAFEEIDIEQQEGAAEHVMQLNGGKRKVPTFEVDGRAFNLSPYDERKLRAELSLTEGGTVSMASTVSRPAPPAGVTRRLARAGGWKLAKRLIKPIPVVGTAVSLGLAGYEIRKKGLKNGLVHVGLDVIPIVGTVKNVVEMFTGDLLPDKDVKTWRRP